VASVVNTVTINGAAAPVFDLVTTARFWPQWHPASQAVEGVTQRSFQLGDFVRERGQIAGIDFLVTWKVVEHVRPNRIVLQCDRPPARITYAFREQGADTEFRRELEYDPSTFRAGIPDAEQMAELMHAQSEEALGRLKALVEKILKEEAG
jgi:uncharacterized protein YndB with AHSA1/START domain